ncbi:MAG TPA: hypothetical protein VHL98_17310 [Microvirga sp.]|jgi:outer membrane immunogenic protein|nr:hypothetical protein [Microvirga sp.]
MTKLFVATAALAGLSAQAMAADLQPRVVAVPATQPMMHHAPPPVMYPAPQPVAYPPAPTNVAIPIGPPPMVPVGVGVPLLTWSGFYTGLNVGYSFMGGGSSSLTTPSAAGDAFTVVPAAGASFGSEGNRGGLLGGVQAGYNMQFGTVVAGIEADLQAADMPRSGNAPGGGVRVAGLRGTVAAPEFGVAPSAVPAGNVYFRSNENRVDLFGTVRGRVGLTFDRFLVYGTGGFAWKGSLGEDDGAEPPAGFYSGASPGAAARGQRTLASMNEGNTVQIGWTIGAGIEYAFASNLTARVEGLYVNLGSDSTQRIVGVTNTGQAITAGSGDRNEFALVRAGLNYRFGTF